MPEVSYTDSEVATFIVLPVVLVAALIAGVWWSWRRAGDPAPRAWRAAAILAVASAAWMAVTWKLAAFGTLRQWNSMPPPLTLLAPFDVASPDRDGSELIARISWISR